MGCVRFLPAALLFTAVFVLYFARICVNIVILSMVAPPASQDTVQDLCRDRSSSSSSESVYSPELKRDVFCWTPYQQSMVKGTFYYGYVILQMHFGRLCEVYGTKRVLGLSTLAVAIITAVSPAATKAGVWWLIGLRFLTGVFSGVIFPCINPMLIRWVSLEEHGRFRALSIMGGTFGVIVIYPLSSFLAIRFGWEVIKANPVVPERKTSLGIPLMSILASRATWAYFLVHLANDYGFYLILTEGPNFIYNVLDKDIKEIGFLSSIPFLGRFICAQLSSFLNDFLIQRPHLISRPNVRRLNLGIALLSPALGLVVMGFLTDEWILCIVIQTVAYTLNGFIVPSFLYVIDFAPSFSGTITGVVNGVCSLSGSIVPFISSALVSSNPSNPAGWRSLFLSATGLYVFVYPFFLWMAKFHPEPFNFDREMTEEEEKEEEEEEEEEKGEEMKAMNV